MPPTQDSGLRTVCWDLSDDPSMIGKTRAVVREVLTSWGLLDLTDDVILVVGRGLVLGLAMAKRGPLRRHRARGGFGVGRSLGAGRLDGWAPLTPTEVGV